MTQVQEARPIIKWVGGKTKLLPELVKRIPLEFNRYYEPFCGGAALFFELQPARAVIGDANADLIAMYEQLAFNVEPVIEALGRHQAKHSEAHYYATRDAWNAHRGTEVERAAAFIYLNKTCFNGLYRVNLDGAFNVGFGKYVNPRICNADALRAAARALQAAELRAGNYRACVADARDGDFVYFDPPYDETFNAYTAGGAFDQRELACCVAELADRGCTVLLSNSATPLIRSLYARFLVEEVSAPRSVNSVGVGRAPVVELLITARPMVSDNPNKRTTVMVDNDASAFRVHTGGADTPSRSRRSKQLGIEGVAREYNAVEQAAEALREAEVAVKAANEIKTDRGEALLFAMQREGIRSYKYTDSEGRRFTVRANSKTTVKITRGWEDDEV